MTASRTSRRSAATSRTSQSKTSSAHAVVGFPVVGVGASAGGLEAFTQLLEHLPLDTGMGFVLVQHLDPDHPSALSQILSRVTALPVREITHNLRVEPDRVYIIPPNTDVAIVRGVLKLQQRRESRGPHRSIDFFFETLAQDQHKRAIGVILSGTATDGTLGLEAIKGEGGITFAQDETAKYDSMPRSAVAAGCVDFVLSAENIAEGLARIARDPYVADDAGEVEGIQTRAVHARGARAAVVNDEASRPDSPAAARQFDRILEMLRHRCGVDFAHYRPSTIQRRIHRRMVLNKLTTLEAYEQALHGNDQELDALYSEALINVTGFFRNPEAFDVLKRAVFPKLIPERDEPLRFWVTGCSTGQEAYSLAIAFTEFAEDLSRAPKLQIFATDLNDGVLDKARAGLYAKTVVQDVSPERLRRFFDEQDGGYRVCKPLREAVVFARQNVLSDPPLSRMDLISCRNLLIYVEPNLQQKVITTFHYALKPAGYLFLGASESIGSSTDLFEPVDKKHKIYSRKPGPSPALRLQHSAQRPKKEKRAMPRPAAPPEGLPEIHFQLTATNKQLEAFVYSIAHDLRAPLRSMQGFADMLVEEAGAALSERGQDYARRISKSAQFMDALLLDLLAFSRISQQPIELGPVSLEGIVQSERSRVEEEIERKGGRVEVFGPWPPVLAHEPTLGQVFSNLVSNALKFVAPGVPPLVRLRSEELNGSVRVWVEDNGKGIAPGHQEQIFRLFTRLHGDRFPGTGMGLAIVQKGVERMSGRVGVESAAGKGSRFWFELKKTSGSSFPGG